MTRSAEGESPLSATSLDSREQLTPSAEEILARLEQYAARRRAAYGEPFREPLPALKFAPLPEPRGIDPANADLFPYDLSGSIIGCALTIMAYVSFGRPLALVVTVGLVAAGAYARTRRWFPSLGLNLIIGTIAGLILVFTA